MQSEPGKYFCRLGMSLHACGQILQLPVRCAGSPEGVQKIKSAIKAVPNQQQAVPALAIACAFSPGAEVQAVINLLSGLRFCLLVRTM